MGCYIVVVIVFFFKQKTAYEMLRSLVGSEMCIRDSTSPKGRPVATAKRSRGVGVHSNADNTSWAAGLNLSLIHI